VKCHYSGARPAAELITGLKPLHKIRFAQNAAYDLALNADSLSVDDPDDQKAGLSRFFKIGDGYGADIFWREGVQVDRICYFDLDRFRERIVRILGSQLFVVRGSLFVVCGWLFVVRCC
jgi:hypothetical protein